MNLVRWVTGPRPDPAGDRQRQGPAGPLPQPDDAAGLGRALGPEPGDGDLVRRRLEDQLRADDRRQRHRLQGARARHVARPRSTTGSIMDIAQLYDIDELRELGGIVDYTVGPAGVKVFVLAEHADPKQRHYLELYKMGDGPALPVLDPLPPGALRDAELDRARRALRRRPRAAARRSGRRGLRRRQARPQGRRGARRVRHVHDLRRGRERRGDERRPLPARGPGRGLPADARRSPKDAGAHLRRRRAARRAASPTGCAPSSTATSAARPGSRSCSRRRMRQRES